MEDDPGSSTLGFAGGPYLAAAVLCEKVLEEKDGALSAIRMVDRVIQFVLGSGTPTSMPETPIELTLLVTLKAGSAVGSQEFRMELEKPSGLRAPFGPSLTVFFEGQDRGSNLVFPLQYRATEEGLYWISILVDGRLLTRVPLRVVYQRQEMPQPS